MPFEKEYSDTLSPDNIKSAAEFIAELISKTRAQEGCDANLLKILETYILKDNPEADVAEPATAEVKDDQEANTVEKAALAIIALAESRAKESSDA